MLARVGAWGKAQSGGREIWWEDLWDPLGMEKRGGRKVAAGAMINT